MTRPLIAVISCHKDTRCTDAQRATWCTGSPIPILVCLGRGTSPKRADVITLDCSDAYKHLPRKVQLAVYWARCNGFTSILTLDDDVYCRPERLELPFNYVGKMMPAKRGYEQAVEKLKATDGWHFY